MATLRAGKAEYAGDCLPRFAERHFETIVEQLDDGVFVLANDGSVRYANTAAIRILNLPLEHLAVDYFVPAQWFRPQDARGTPVSINEPDVERWFHTRDAFSKRVFALDLPDRERRWLLISGGALNFEGSESEDILLSFSDITAQLAMVEQLVHQANHDLFDRATQPRISEAPDL